MGFCSAARFAGRKPKNNPVAKATPNATNTERGEMMVRIPASLEMETAPTTPTIIPMIPPDKLIKIASSKNWEMISNWVAPNALRVPISRVRSSTDASMMFMMPIPPTKRLIPAMMLSTRLKISLVRCCCSSN